MSIYAWITLLIFLIYIALVYTASRTGWLERQNMSLAMGLIIMWRTQRGKDLIDKLSGRATEAQLVEKRIQELEKDLAEANEAYDVAGSDGRLVGTVREYRTLRNERAQLLKGKDPTAIDRLNALDMQMEETVRAFDEDISDRRRSEINSEVDRIRAEIDQVYASIDQGSDGRIKELTYELLSREDQVAPQSKFRDLLKDPDEMEVSRELAEIVAASQSQQEIVGNEISTIKLDLSDNKEQLAKIEQSSDFPKQQRKSRRRVRFWKGYGNVAIGIVMVFMFIMFALLVWQSFIVVRIPPGVIQPQQMLGIPGVNPVIPLWYGIFGLAVAMLVHEFAHGILARAGKITVKSLGLLYLIVPIGAFVEPDEDQLAKVDRGRRSRVFAVGPATNILVAFLVVAIFAWGFMGSVEQAEEGTVLNYIIDTQTVQIDNETEAIKQTPASIAGLQPWSTLMSIEALTGPPLGPDGENLSILKGNDDFHDTMSRSHGGQDVHITWYHDGNYYSANVTLWDKGEVYGDDYSGQGYLGASSYLLYEVPAGEYPDSLARPMARVDDALSFRNMTFFYISLPFTNPSLQPPSPAIKQAFEVTGPLAALGDSGFWIIANLLYWIFWLNLMVGIFNALPAIPLDGGFIFRDGFSWLIQKMRPSRKRDDVDAMATKVTMIISFLILFLILWQFVGPMFGSLIGTN